MKQHFKSLGWVYGGMCGCQDNKEVYTHESYPDWQVWISIGGDVVQFRKSYGNSRDTKRKGTAGVRNYGEAYDYWVINNRD